MKTEGSVRTRHDEWSKRALSLWLKELGDVELDARIGGESRRGDVLYTERSPSQTERRKLGALGELARGRVLFELFRNPPTSRELTSCVLKAIDLAAQAVRIARRKKQPLAAVRGPMLCVILPSLSRHLAREGGAEAMTGGKAGLYTLAPMLRTILVVVDELPVERATLWLRLLGRGRAQTRALQELLEIREQDPLLDATLKLAAVWQRSLPPPGHESEEERELRMSLERVYERWEQKVKAQARREGKAEGKAEAVLAVLAGRALPITAAQRKQVLACTDGAELDAWLRAAGTTASVKALLAVTSSPPPREKQSRPTAPPPRRAASASRRPERRP